MNCTIRPWRIEDAEDLSLSMNNKNVQNNLRDGLPFPYTPDDARDFISSALKSDNKSYIFAISVFDRAIGCISAARLDNIHRRTAELGYFIAEAYWGNGLGTSALMQICDYIFSNTDIIRLYAEPFARNAASCRILEKAGFSLEGVLRKNALKNGEVLDMMMYARLRD